jgi:peptide/nickel transport system substrate-binding protein
MRRAIVAISLVITLAVGCAGPSSSGQTTGPAAGQNPEQQAGGTASSSSNRTLVMALKHNFPDLSFKIPAPGGDDALKRIFNATLVIADGQATPRPYLAEVLPELGTDTWQVHPDGAMETTYKLRPNLTWHDGAPLTAEDFVLAWQVYLHPALGNFETKPENLMESVLAPDPRTVVIRWSRSYPQANSLAWGALDPLPRHILGELFSSVTQGDAAAAEAMVNHRYWNYEYVGAGPYRLERWEPSQEWEGVAFDGHALGRPKIDRIIVKLIPDLNTTLANVLAGEIHYAPDNTLQWEHGQTLLRDWAPSGRGSVILKRGVPIVMEVQQRPDRVGHPALLDVRVRRGIAHAIDRGALNDGLFDGRGFPTEHIVPEGAPFFADVDRVVTKYALDPRRTEQLMNEAGYAKDQEGIFADASGQRFRTELRYSQSPEWERRAAIMSASLRQAGILADPYPLPVEAGRNRETRATYPALSSRGGGVDEQNFTTDEIAAPSNRWGGRNRAGWSNPEYDQLFAAYTSTLSRPERIQNFAGMQRLLSEHLPVYVLHFYMRVNAHAGDLVGVEAETPAIATMTLQPSQHWNIHEWHWR